MRWVIHSSCAEFGTEASYASTRAGTTWGQKVPRGLISAMFSSASAPHVAT